MTRRQCRCLRLPPGISLQACEVESGPDEKDLGEDRFQIFFIGIFSRDHILYFVRRGIAPSPELSGDCRFLRSRHLPIRVPESRRQTPHWKNY